MDYFFKLDFPSTSYYRRHVELAQFYSYVENVPASTGLHIHFYYLDLYLHSTGQVPYQDTLLLAWSEILIEDHLLGKLS
jgi:hypothetical protein